MKPDLVVLDGFGLTPSTVQKTPPGEPAWTALMGLCELTVHPRTPADLTVQRIGDAPLVQSNKTLLPAEVLRACPNLKYVGLHSTGTNVVDLEVARELGIEVTNIPGYSTPSVAQHVFAMLLSLTVSLHDTHDSVQAGGWEKSPDFCYTVAPWRELAGKTLGLVGAGAIGQAVGRIGAAMGMDIMVHSRTEKPVEFPCRWVSLDALFAQSDVVSLHCPLTEATQGMVDSARLATMKPDAVLINTGRGPLIVEDDLAAALREGQLAGACLDVLSQEPPQPGHPLIGIPNCIVTPHLAWASREARQRCMDIATDNVRAFLDGRPQNVVN